LRLRVDTIRCVGANSTVWRGVRIGQAFIHLNMRHREGCF